jgi:hypothetical protein
VTTPETSGAVNHIIVSNIMEIGLVVSKIYMQINRRIYMTTASHVHVGYALHAKQADAIEK